MATLERNSIDLNAVLPKHTYMDDRGRLLAKRQAEKQWKRQQVLHDILMLTLHERSRAAATSGNPVGHLYSFGVADGAAEYIVTKAKPLTVAHLVILDGYRLPAAHIRGLTKREIMDEQLTNINPVWGDPRPLIREGIRENPEYRPGEDEAMIAAYLHKVLPSVFDGTPVDIGEPLLGREVEFANGTRGIITKSRKYGYRHTIRVPGFGTLRLPDAALDDQPGRRGRAIPVRWDVRAIDLEPGQSNRDRVFKIKPEGGGIEFCHRDKITDGRGLHRAYI